MHFCYLKYEEFVCGYIGGHTECHPVGEHLQQDFYILTHFYCMYCM